VTDIIN